METPRIEEGAVILRIAEDVGAARIVSSTSRWTGTTVPHRAEPALTARATFNPKTGVLEVGLAMHNPAIWVPDLKRIVFGMESWWGVIDNPDDLKQITDADIQNVWYVKALQGLEGGAVEG
jgi:hypothetical protein